MVFSMIWQKNCVLLCISEVIKVMLNEILVNYQCMENPIHIAGSVQMGFSEVAL